MKMMFAVGRVTRDATKVLVTRQPAGAQPSKPAPADSAAAKQSEPGDFRAECASPDTVH